MQDLPVDALGDVHAFRWIGLRSVIVLLGSMFLVVGDVAGQRIGPVVNQVFGKLALFGADFRVRRDVQRVDDSCIKSCFNGMVKKDAVENGTGMRLQSK